MDLWSPSHKWAKHPDKSPPEAPADLITPHDEHLPEHHDHDEHHDEHRDQPLTIAAAIVMWFTVLLPYIAVIGMIAWTATLPLGWLTLVGFAISYLLIGFGVTIGYHRLLAHRAFNTYTPIEAAFLVLGCMAMQGPPIRWAANHRRHHQKSDQEGDPHSPHLAGNGVRGVVLGLWHAHSGWLLTPDKPNTDRSVKDLLRSRLITTIDRLYWLWLLISVAVPFGIGFGVTGKVLGGAIAVFWAVVVRIALMHHATWSVNSICHFFGYQSYKSGDHSRNNPIVAVISLGEGWHNNHHAFPTSARHGLQWFEVDLSWIVIWTLETLRLAWDVRRPSASARSIKAATSTPTPAAAAV